MTLYSTPAGLIDLAIMLAVSVFALWKGDTSTRLLAASLVACYVLNRASMSFGAPVISVASQSIAEAILMAGVLWLCSGRIAKGFAGVFFVDLVIYAAFLNGFLRDFETMKLASLVTFYFQILIVLAGAINGTLVSYRRGGRHKHINGNHRAVPLRRSPFGYNPRTERGCSDALGGLKKAG
jgi:hypothetical protein